MVAMRDARRCFVPMALSVLLVSSLTPPGRGADVLFIGDGGDNSVKRFDADTGASLDPAGEPFVPGVTGPRGLVVDGGALLVVNQNVDLNIPGEVLRFDAATGAFGGAVVPASEKDAPFAPRGMVLGGVGDLFIANLTTASGTSPGRINRYDAASGDLL